MCCDNSVYISYSKRLHSSRKILLRRFASREQEEHNKLNVMDDVSDLADPSSFFANLLTLNSKFVNHIIHPDKAVSRLVFSQMQMYHFLLGSVDMNSVTSILDRLFLNLSHDKKIPV